MDSTATATTSPPRDRERAEDALRVALEENARLRAECEALHERQARREVEFRLELRQLAAQCASLAASAAVTSASATPEDDDTVADVVVFGRRGGERGDR